MICYSECGTEKTVPVLTVLQSQTLQIQTLQIQMKRGITMSTRERARALMIRHHQSVKNRHQSMLTRAAAEVGLDNVDYWNHIQGKPLSGEDYDRSGASLS
jgi:hypothetical protein